MTNSNKNINNYAKEAYCQLLQFWRQKISKLIGFPEFFPGYLQAEM